jgi:hypothetical protein
MRTDGMEMIPNTIPPGKSWSFQSMATVRSI